MQSEIDDFSRIASYTHSFTAILRDEKVGMNANDIQNFKVTAEDEDNIAVTSENVHDFAMTTKDFQDFAVTLEDVWDFANNADAFIL